MDSVRNLWSRRRVSAAANISITAGGIKMLREYTLISVKLVSGSKAA